MYKAKGKLCITKNPKPDESNRQIKITAKISRSDEGYILAWPDIKKFWKHQKRTFGLVAKGKIFFWKMYGWASAKEQTRTWNLHKNLKSSHKKLHLPFKKNWLRNTLFNFVWKDIVQCCFWFALKKNYYQETFFSGRWFWFCQKKSSREGKKPSPKKLHVKLFLSSTAFFVGTEKFMS